MEAGALSSEAVTNVTGDATVPTFSSATVDGTELTLNYNEALDTASVPATADFTVSVAGTNQTPTGVAVAGQTVTLTLGTAATAGQTVTVSYTAGTNPIQDLAGNDAAALTSQAVTNN
ncbi:MAG: SwmB domain-containing protein, partial [Chloroflexi bacterium]|nr:SwmB domain-containing protein [Chloroflexota bacterium]